MPKPILVIECTWCATPWLLTLACRRDLLGLPVQYGICPAHRRQREDLMFDLDREDATS